ncbi:MAG: hypothetical protein AB7U81_14265 [Thiohalomonadaceae bacterium]
MANWFGRKDEAQPAAKAGFDPLGIKARLGAKKAKTAEEQFLAAITAAELRPEITAALIKRGMYQGGAAGAAAAMKYASAVLDVVAAAHGTTSPAACAEAAGYIERDADLPLIRGALANRLAAEDEAIDLVTTHPAPAGTRMHNKANHQPEVYRRRSGTK